MIKQLVIGWTRNPKTGLVTIRLGCGHSKVSSKPLSVGVMITCITCGAQNK